MALQIFVGIEVMACCLISQNHYLNQCWLIVNWIFKNKSRWNLNQDALIFIEENAFENVICHVAAILFRLWYVEGMIAFNGLSI